MNNSANAAIVYWYAEKHTKVMNDEISRFEEVFERYPEWRGVLLRLVQSDVVNSLLHSHEKVAAEYRYPYRIDEIIDKITFAATFVGHEIMDDGDPWILHIPYRGYLCPVLVRFNPNISDYAAQRIIDPKQVLDALDWHEAWQAKRDKLLRREPTKHENNELIDAFVDSYRSKINNP